MNRALDQVVRIRPENPDSPNDRAAIHAVNVAAFGRSDEADLVDHLRDDGIVLISLIAAIAGTVAGHILFTRMWIDAPQGNIPAVALAPVAVAPEHQRKGIGTVLIKRGLELLREKGECIVIVVGHPDYYSRFGFSPEKASMIESPFPPEAFMAMELRPGALDGVHGRVVYPPAFGL
jgi:putative acetyltransferase